ncbi:hypothetical protein V6Z11_D05G016200 [Gossypium hirsutum]
MLLLTPFMMLCCSNASRKLSLLENSLPTFNSPEFNYELVRSHILCDKSGNSNALSVDRSTLCMWVRDEYALNRESSSSSSEPPSTSSGSIGTGFSLENNGTSTLLGLSS